MKTLKVLKQLFWCLVLVFLFCLSTAVVISAGELENQLLEAIKRGDISSVRLLLDKGANVNALAKDPIWGPGGETTPLWMAAFLGNVGLVRLLLDRGADVNMKDHYGSTALISAAFRGSVEVMRLLIEKGADVNAVGQKGMTPLMHAAHEGRTDAVRLLIEKGARLNMKNDNGDTALSIAEKYESHGGPHETVHMFKAAGLGK